MIVRDRPNALQLLFILRGSILPSIVWRVLTVLLLSGLVAVLNQYHPALGSRLTYWRAYLAGGGLVVGLPTTE